MNDKYCVGNFLLNLVVKPTNRGEHNGHMTDWSVYRGRAVEYFPPTCPNEVRDGGRYLVVWFGAAKHDMGKTSIYPARDLAVAN